MKIENNNQTFNGIKIASARAKLNGVVSNYELYRITPKDSAYLDNLELHLDLPRLWSGLKQGDYFFWKKTISMMFSVAKSSSAESVVIAKDGALCGGINYNIDSHNKCNVAYRVTWPVESEKKAPFAGKILYMQLFKKCLDKGVNSIKTTVSRFGPFSAISKCCQLGFGLNGGDNYTEIMGIGEKGMRNTFDKFQDIIEITSIPESEQKDFDLFTVLQSPAKKL